MNFFKRIRILLWLIPALLVTGFSFYLLLLADEATVSATLSLLGIETGLANTPSPGVRLDLDLQVPLVIVQTPADGGEGGNSAEITPSSPSLPPNASATLTAESTQTITLIEPELYEGHVANIVATPTPAVQITEVHDSMSIALLSGETEPSSYAKSVDLAWPTPTAVATLPVWSAEAPRQQIAPTPTTSSESFTQAPLAEYPTPTAILESEPIPQSPYQQPEEQALDEYEDKEEDDEDEYEDLSDAADDDDD